MNMDRKKGLKEYDLGYHQPTNRGKMCFQIYDG